MNNVEIVVIERVIVNFVVQKGTTIEELREALEDIEGDADIPLAHLLKAGDDGGWPITLVFERV